jgi:crotonobetainyl-CoA:carnitine CoA-transferase CaiB-like acyl-CoA transferase
MSAAIGETFYQAGKDTPPPPGTPLTIEQVKQISSRLVRTVGLNTDTNAGMVAATALLMGLYARELTGKGQYIECSMLRSNAYAHSDDFIRYEGKPARKQLDAELLGFGALYRLYQCGTGWVLLACPSAQEWQRFARMIGKEELIVDPRFATAAAREKNDAELCRLLETVFRDRTAQEWEAELTADDVACVVADAHEYYQFFLEDTHLTANSMAVDVEHEIFGAYRRHGSGVRFSQAANRVGPAILAGAHTRAILTELGYTEDEMEQLKADRVVTWYG